MKSFKKFLFENRINWLKKNIESVDTSHDHLADKHEPHEVIDHFANKADPTRKKVYTQWVMNQYKKQNIRQEDATGLHRTLSDFEEHKHRLEKRDINQYKHPSELENAVEPHVEKEKSEDPFKHPNHPHPGTEKIHNGKNIDVYKLHDHAAACHYGKGTSWCVSKGPVPEADTDLDSTLDAHGREHIDAGEAAESEAIFHDYKHEGPLYLMHSKNDNRRHLMHFPSEQFANERDHMKPLHELVNKYPEMKNVNEFHNTSHAYWFSRNEDEAKKALHAHPESADHPNLPDHHVERLIDDPGGHHHELIQNQNLKPEHVNKLLDKRMDNDVTVQYALHNHGHKITDENLDKIVDHVTDPMRVGSTHGYVVNALFGSRSKERLTDDHHKKIVDYGFQREPSVLAHIPRDARSADTIHHFLDSQKRHGAFGVAATGFTNSLIKNPNWNEEHAKKALDMKDPIYDASLAQHVKKPSQIETLLNRKHDPEYQKKFDNRLTNSLAREINHVYTGLIKNPNLQSEHLDRIVDDHKNVPRQVWGAIADHVGAITHVVKPRHHDAVLEHGHPDAVVALTKNPNLSDDTLHSSIDKAHNSLHQTARNTVTDLSLRHKEHALKHLSTNTSLKSDHIDKLLDVASSLPVKSRDGINMGNEYKDIIHRGLTKGESDHDLAINPKLQTHHLDRLSHEVDDYRAASKVANHDKTEDHHVHNIIDRFSSQRDGLFVPRMNPKKVNNDHLDKMIQDPGFREQVVNPKYSLLGGFDLKHHHVIDLIRHGSHSNVKKLVRSYDLNKEQKQKADEKLQSI